ncbi:MAG: hypothetical protein WCR42_14230 [bacterium]
MKKILLVLFIVLSSFTLLKSEDYCNDYLLLDGYEDLLSVGMDTTFNWWAITKPFTAKQRLIVNGNETDVYDNITSPVFSPDGLRWAAFGMNNGSLTLITDSGATYLPGISSGELHYSANSETLLYSFYEGTVETICSPTDTFKITNRAGQIFTNYSGTKVAFLGLRGSYYVININGRESQQYDEILPIGFWYDDTFLYAARLGEGWEICKNKEPLTEKFAGIAETAINLEGTVAAVLVNGYDGWGYGLMFSDEYSQPLQGRAYKKVTGLALHPRIPLFSYKGFNEEKYSVTMNSVEYVAGRITSQPQFTYDGSELYFFASNEINYFININGKRTNIKYFSGADAVIPRAPGSDTYAFTNGTNLVMQFIEQNKTHHGTMMDWTGEPRYNWRENAYEALGVINRKLYLLTCTVPRY